MKIKRLLILILFFGAIAFFISNWMQKGEDKEKVKYKKSLTLHKKKRTLAVPKSKKKFISKKRSLKKRITGLKLIEEKDVYTSDAQGNIYLSNISNDGEYLLYDGDLIFEEVENLAEVRKRPFLRVPKIRKWKTKKIPYTFGDKLQGPLHEVIKLVFEKLKQNTSINFVPRTSEKDFVEFTHGKKNCYSALGYQGGKQKISLSRVCNEVAIAHEIMHTLGFIHEHAREDRDDFIEVLWSNISPEHHVQFKKLPFSFSGLEDYPYDINSRMHYNSLTFSLNGDDYTIQGIDGSAIYTRPEAFSLGDFKRINEWYP